MKHVLAAIVTLVAAGDVGLAHHSMSVQFDVRKPVHLVGTVSDIAWVNPHVWIYLAVPGAAGSVVKWSVETDSPHALSTRGCAKGLFKRGIPVVIDGYAARDGSATACSHSVLLDASRKIAMTWCVPRSDRPSATHVRYDNDSIARAFDRATDRSTSFRDLVARIDASDVIAYVREGPCPTGLVRSCVQLVSDSGGRVVLVHIDPRLPVTEVVRQLAHELQHVSEISSARDVVDGASLGRFYERTGFRTDVPGGQAAWETTQALATEHRVATETATYKRAVDSAFFGAWTLNVARSSFDHRQPPAAARRWHGDRGYGLMSTVLDSIDDDGRHVRDSVVYRPDGRDYPVLGSPEISGRTVAETALDRFAARFVVKENGRIVVAGLRTLHKDGVTMTVETEGTDREGRTWKSVERWEKRPASSDDCDDEIIAPESF